MDTFQIEPEHFDLEATMTCGQTFSWHRVDGELYGSGKSEFYTFRDGEPIIVEEKGDVIEVSTPHDIDTVKAALGLDRDLEKVFESIPLDENLEKAMGEYWGLRVLQDEFLPTLMSYITSSQMRIERIKKMHNAIAKQYGETVEYDGKKLLKYPGRDQIAEVEEDELRELGLGYRAEYVARSAQMVQELDEDELRELDYTDAREELKELHGVGNKVADCVLLFSLGFHQAAPLDTWAKKVLKTHYPEIHDDRYEKASENFRERYGENTGYVQEYLFHAARNGILEVEE